MAKFPADAPKGRVLRAFALLGFRVSREGTHIGLIRENEDGTRSTLTLPNHRTIHGPTIQSACRQSNITRDEFLRAYEES